MQHQVPNTPDRVHLPEAKPFVLRVNLCSSAVSNPVEHVWIEARVVGGQVAAGPGKGLRHPTKPPSGTDRKAGFSRILTPPRADLCHKHGV